MTHRACSLPRDACTPTPRPEKNATHVVALSGGADSTAMALAMKDARCHVDHYLCTPTGNELPQMQAHWDKLETLLDKPLTRITVGEGLVAQSRARAMLPNARVRWCTRALKVEPCLAFLARITADSNGAKPVLYVGLRADEPTREGLYSERVRTRCPLREWGWTRKDVLDYLRHRGVEIPRRTDCALCPFQRLQEWWELWRDHGDEYHSGVELEAAVSAARGRELSIRSASRDTWPAGLAELRRRFEAGDIPRSAKRQLQLFEDDETSSCRVCRL